MNEDAVPALRDGSSEGYRLPPHEELVNAFIECQEAKQREEHQYADAVNAGVARDRMPSPGASEKTPVKIAIASPLA